MKLRLSEAEFGAITFHEYELLMDCWRDQRKEETEFQRGLAASTIAAIMNNGFRPREQQVRAEELLTSEPPTRRRRKIRIKQSAEEARAAGLNARTMMREHFGKRMVFVKPEPK